MGQGALTGRYGTRRKRKGARALWGRDAHDRTGILRGVGGGLVRIGGEGMRRGEASDVLLTDECLCWDWVVKQARGDEGSGASGEGAAIWETASGNKRIVIVEGV